MEDLFLINESVRKNFVFSNLNIVFGYSGSGKTTFLEDLNTILNGKDKNWLWNGSKILPSDFNVIFVSGTENISTHLKLSSKSLLSKYISRGAYSSEFQQACESLSGALELTRKEIEHTLGGVLNEARVSIKNIDDPIDFLLSNISISCSDIASSSERKSLFRVIGALASLGGAKTVVLIDDFANNLDEENTVSFLSDIKGLNAYFVLTSNKSIPQSYLSDDIKIFASRDDKVIELPKISSLVLDAVDGQPDYLSFEEYMLGKGYSEKSGIVSRYLELIRKDVQGNFLRILTSKNPRLELDGSATGVSIIPRSESEEKIYRYIFDLLGIK